MKEEWKDVIGYEGLYIVSNYGNVKSIDRYVKRIDGVVQFRNGKALTKRKNQDGYFIVKLSKDGYSSYHFVHRLVGFSFVDGYFTGAEINHKDCNRENNSYDNLEWVSHTDNIQYSINQGTHISKIKDMCGKNNPNYGNRVLRKKYSSNKELSKIKQGRQGSSNGKSKAIHMQCRDGTIIRFDYIGKCAEYLIANSLTRSVNVNSVRTGIAKAIKENRKYNGIKLYF